MFDILSHHKIFYDYCIFEFTITKTVLYLIDLVPEDIMLSFYKLIKFRMIYGSSLFLSKLIILRQSALTNFQSSFLLQPQNVPGIGELALGSLMLGASNTLLNADHYGVYFKGMPLMNGKVV